VQLPDQQTNLHLGLLIGGMIFRLNVFANWAQIPGRRILCLCISVKVFNILSLSIGSSILQHWNIRRKGETTKFSMSPLLYTKFTDSILKHV